jgi:uncharacterized protein YebE (UPF0316 family)
MKELILNVFVVFIVKIIDNILSTSKQILIQRNRAVLAAITVILSNIIFYKLINVVGSSSSDLYVYIIAFASGIGTLLALIISNKLSKDRTYVNIILNDDKEVMMEFRDWLKDNKITNLTTDGYTKDWNKTLAITAYAETKEQSKLIDEYINGSNSKFKRIIQIQ